MIKRAANGLVLATLAMWLVGDYFNGTDTDFVSGSGLIHILALGAGSIVVAMVIGFVATISVNSLFQFGRFLGRRAMGGE